MRAFFNPAARRHFRQGLPMKLFKSFLSNESGATATEYGLIIALVAVVITGAMKVIGTQVELKLNVIKNNTNLALPS